MLKKYIQALILHLFHHFTTGHESEFDFISDNSESELSDFDPDIFGCGTITTEVENNWRISDPLDEIYGITTSQLVKETVNIATEETQCAGLKFFNAITPGEDQNLIETCIEISYWCCYKTVKKGSSIIVETNANLMYGL